MESRNQNTPLELLEKNIQRYLCTFLDANGLFAMKQTSREWKHIITEDNTIVENGKIVKEIYTDKLNEDPSWKSYPFRNLLSHVALGDWKAKKIWENDPSLLTCRGTVYHPNRIYDDQGNVLFDVPADQNSGRYQYVDVTPFKIALMNEEWGMATEMSEHIDADEVDKQFLDVFPDGKIVKYHCDNDEAKKRLEVVFAEVINDTSINENNRDVMNESTRSALNNLYAYVKPIPEHRVGLVFDADIYAEALELFENNLGDFKNRNHWDQRLFWCIRVEEYLAGLLPTGYLRSHAQGIVNQTKNTGCTLSDNSSYYAFRRQADSIPGFHFFVGVLGAVEKWGGRQWFGRGERFKTYVKQKREQGQILCGDIRATKKRHV